MILAQDFESEQAIVNLLKFLKKFDNKEHLVRLPNYSPCVMCTNENKRPQYYSSSSKSIRKSVRFSESLIASLSDSSSFFNFSWKEEKQALSSGIEVATVICPAHVSLYNDINSENFDEFIQKQTRTYTHN